MKSTALLAVLSAVFLASQSNAARLTAESDLPTSELLRRVLLDHLAEFQEVTGIHTTDGSAAPPQVPLDLPLDHLNTKAGVKAFKNGQLEKYVAGRASLAKREVFVEEEHLEERGNPFEGKTHQEILADLTAARLDEFKANTGIHTNEVGAIPVEAPLDLPLLHLNTKEGVKAFKAGKLEKYVNPVRAISVVSERDFVDEEDFVDLEERDENPFEGKSTQEILADLTAARLDEFKANTGIHTTEAGAIPVEVPLDLPLLHLNTKEGVKAFKTGKLQKYVNPPSNAALFKREEAASLDVHELLARVLDLHIIEYQRITGAVPDIDEEVTFSRRSTHEIPQGAAPNEDLLRRVIDENKAHFESVSKLRERHSFAKRQWDFENIDDDDNVQAASSKPLHEKLQELIAQRMDQFKKITGYTPTDRFAHPPEDPPHIPYHHDEFRRVRRSARDA